MEEEVVDNITKQKGLIDYLFDGQKYIELFNTYKGIIIPILIFVVFFIYCLVSRIRINKKTRLIIQELKDQKKYIPHLFYKNTTILKILAVL